MKSQRNKKEKRILQSKDTLPNVKQKPEKSFGRWLFLLVMFFVYTATFFISRSKAEVTLHIFIKLLFEVLPILLIVYLFQLLLDYFVSNKRLKHFMEAKKGIREWVIAIVGGILSVGPGYVWYPLLKDLKDKGVKDRFLVAFLYNRAIKIPWLPMLIFYFGWMYSLILLVVMVIASIPTAIITERFVNR